MVDQTYPNTEVVIVDRSNGNAAGVTAEDRLQTEAKIISLPGTSGISLSISNLLKTNQMNSAIGWNTVLNLTVPTGKVWYLKNLSISTETSASVRFLLDGVISWHGRSDADDFNEAVLYAYKAIAGTVIKVEMDAGAVGKELNANMVIYENGV